MSALLGAALADELALASRMLGELAYDLGSDQATLRRHLTSIQSIDRVTQMLLIVADLLRDGLDTADLSHRVTLEDMAQRIGRTTTMTAAMTTMGTMGTAPTITG